MGGSEKSTRVSAFIATETVGPIYNRRLECSIDLGRCISQATTVRTERNFVSASVGHREDAVWFMLKKRYFSRQRISAKLLAVWNDHQAT